MSVCLITPPSPFLLDERVFVSLGILRVAACLERDGVQVEHLDLSGIENYEVAAEDHASRTGASVFGLTATTPQLPAAMKVVEALRRCRPDARIILGGPHITLVNAARKREAKLGIWNGRATKAYKSLEAAFDVLVAGDGDDAVFHALMPDAPKLIDADDAASQLFLTNARYNELPFPARHLVDMDSYHYSIDGVRASSLIAQLGCCFNCHFCGGRLSSMLRRIRTRTTENVVSEIVHLYREYGLTAHMMYDDELNVNKSIVDLMDAIADAGTELGVEWKLRGFIKSELFNDRQAESMHRAGFRWILVGFESGNSRILENINKKATREDNTRCMEIAHAHGLKVKALMSLGHPGESEETAEDTRQWLLGVRPDDFDLTIISCYPGTGYYDHAEETSPGVWTYTAPKSGDRLHSYEIDFEREASYYKGGLEDYKSYVFTDHLSTGDIVRLRDSIERDVRARLDIPFNAGAPGVRYEASYGQLPGYMLRRSREEVPV